MNCAMRRAIELGEAIDLAANPRTPDGDYVLTEVVEGSDYCDSSEGNWIWTIGRLATGEVLASSSMKFCSHPRAQCLWVR